MCNSCNANTDTNMKIGCRGRKYLRLRTKKQILPDKELTVYNRTDAFSPNNLNFLCSENNATNFRLV